LSSEFLLISPLFANKNALKTTISVRASKDSTRQKFHRISFFKHCRPFNGFLEGWLVAENQ